MDETIFSMYFNKYPFLSPQSVIAVSWSLGFFWFYDSRIIPALKLWLVCLFLLRHIRTRISPTHFSFLPPPLLNNLKWKIPSTKIPEFIYSHEQFLPEGQTVFRVTANTNVHLLKSEVDTFFCKGPDSKWFGY